MPDLLAFVPWAALLAALVGLTLLIYRRAPQVRISRELPGNAFVGDKLSLRVRLTVRSPWPCRVQLSDPPPLTLIPDKVVDIGGLVWGRSEHTLGVDLQANRRGVFAWQGVTLRWADPFGLWWRHVTLPAPSTLEVYPRTHGLRLPELLRPLLSEGALSRTLGLDDPLSLRGARPYVPGDPPGRVAWRLTAHTGHLTVREPERTANGTLHVHIDLHGSADYLESAVRLAASLLGEAAELGLPVAVSTARGEAPAGRTPEALRLALRVLAQAARDDGAQGIPAPQRGSNLIVLTQNAGSALVGAALSARAYASRVSLVALPEGYYLEPGETGRPIRHASPDEVRELERRAGVLAEAGVLVFVLRGNQSVLTLGA